MALEIVQSCPHDISDQDVAAHCDGLCPLCLRDDVVRLRGALQEIANGGNVVSSDWKSTGPKTREQMAHIASEALLASVGGSS